jgi:hypothetical protein
VKYFFKFLLEEHPKVKTEGFEPIGGGLFYFLLACFLLFGLHLEKSKFSGFLVVIAALGLLSVAYGSLYFAFYVLKRLARDLNTAYHDARRKKFNPDRYYVCWEKYDVPLPEPQEILIAKIQLGHPMRRFIRPGAFEKMAASLNWVGLLKPIKVRPLTPEEKNQDPEHDYFLVGGQIRIGGANLLKWEKIKAYVLELDKDQTWSEGMIDNNHPFKDWVSEYEEIEKQFVDMPNITIGSFDQLARRNPGDVTLFLGILELLTPKARKLIMENEWTSQEEHYELHREPFNEYKAQFLEPLAGICHDVVLNRLLVERTVKMALKKQMGGPEMEELVEWVAEGFFPEDFGSQDGFHLKNWYPLDSKEAEWPKFLKDLKPVEDEPTKNRMEALTPEQKVEMVPIDNLIDLPINQEVIQEGGLKSFVKFMHKCLRQKGLGISKGTNYVWAARSMMAWIDFKQFHRFPLFDPGPDRMEEPVYVFYISEVGGQPVQWIAAAEVDDVLRGCHVEFQPIWADEFAKCIQVGLLDRIGKTDGLWAGGICGVGGIYKMTTQESIAPKEESK